MPDETEFTDGLMQTGAVNAVTSDFAALTTEARASDSDSRRASQLLEKYRSSGDYDAGFVPKRPDYLHWDEYHMATAMIASMRSKDPVTQVGAVLANSKNIICSIGYNGMPRGCDDDTFPWGKHPERSFLNKHSFVCHAEENAILNANGPLSDCILYTTLFPCNKCVKMLLQKDIREVVYLQKKEVDDDILAAELMLESAGVKVRKFQSSRDSITLNFK